MGANVQRYIAVRQQALVLAGLVLVADLASKAWALWALGTGVLPLWLVNDLTLGQVGLAFGWNRGMSFSALAHVPFAPFMLAAVAVAAVAYFTHWLAEAAWPSLHQAGLALIIGGALGNFVDRVYHGAVVDFLVLSPFGLFPYTFNVADVGITLGVALLLLDMWRKRS